MSDMKFPDGLIVKAPRDGAPDFVKGSLSIKREELIAWLSKESGDWINLDIKESQGGKWYAAVNEWKPQQSGMSQANQASVNSQAPDGFDEDAPF